MVRQLREMLARERFPHAMILAGPEGAGKYTLALMLARTMNCLQPTETDGLPDYCGVCSNCERIGQAEDMEARAAEALETREGMRETDKPVRYKPADARRKVFIFTNSAFMKEAANSLLKVLEEPPDFATIVLLARNPGDLLATIRSRCVTFTLAPLGVREIEQYLERKRPEWNVRQRQLVAKLSGGAVGRAQSLNLEEYMLSRKDALALLTTAARPDDHSLLFRTTETYRAGGEGREKTDLLLAAIYSVLKDLLAISSGTPELVRNTDIVGELKTLAASIDFRWISQATQQLSQVQSGMRRNVLRSLSLDAFALSLERQGP